MKNFLKVIFIVCTLSASMAHAAFIGHYDFVGWTKTVDGGSVDTGSLPDTVKFTSNNSGSNLYSAQDYTIDALFGGIVKFDWSYVTFDADGSLFDPFGYIVNGVFTQLSVDGLYEEQFGTASFIVAAGDIFGFRMASVDSGWGAGVATVTNFIAPTPLPAAMWLMLAPLFGMLGKRRKALA